MSVSNPAFNYTNLLANATTLIRTGRGLLHNITVNTKGATGNTITVYDGVSASGITIVIATGTAADVTVCWIPL